MATTPAVGDLASGPSPHPHPPLLAAAPLPYLADARVRDSEVGRREREETRKKEIVQPPWAVLMAIDTCFARQLLRNKSEFYTRFHM